jgi:hypothetical protein
MSVPVSGSVTVCESARYWVFVAVSGCESVKMRVWESRLLGVRNSMGVPVSGSVTVCESARYWVFVAVSGCESVKMRV